MKRLLTMKSLLRVLPYVIFLTLTFGCQTANKQGNVPSPPDSFDGFISSLLIETATKHFDKEKKPVIRVVVFPFTDQNGDITTGSMYLTNRVRLAFGRSPQFDLLPVEEFSKNAIITATLFDKDTRVRDRLATDLKADVYLFGEIETSDPTLFVCKIKMWEIDGSSDDPAMIQPAMIQTDEFAWPPDLTDSGYAFFREVLISAAQQSTESLKAINLADVLILTQPMCDDLNLSWEIKSDGMIYDRRKERGEKSLRDRTGQIMQGRVKSPESLKELSFVIKNFTLLTKETNGKAAILEPYMLPIASDYYFVPYEQGKGEWGLRFMYLWSTPGRSQKPSDWESGKGWQLYVAQEDWSFKMPVGVHTATATLKPVAETEFGTKLPRSEFVSKFKFAVKPGKNIYVINYVYRRDKPEIFIRRLEIKDTKDEKGEGIKKITAIYKVYGLD